MEKSSMEKIYSKMQVEDKALKSAVIYFGQELLPYLEVDCRIVRLMPTEQIRLEAIRATEDILFETEDGDLVHFEFESVEVTEDDLRRFRAYDAYTGLHYKRTVTTYVVCSGKVKRVQNSIQEGINCYNIIPLCMKQKDADALFVRLKEKQQKGDLLTKEDLIPLLLTPLMSGSTTVKRRILEARELIDSGQTNLNREEKQHMEAVLYTFACKFLEKTDLDEVKEALCMTALGEMIWNDGLERGLEQGLEQGREINLITMICRKLKKGKTPEQIADDLDEEYSKVERICNAAKQCGPEYDSDEVYRKLNQ